MNTVFNVLKITAFFVFVLIAFIVYAFVGNPPRAVVEHDMKQAAEIAQIRNNKSDWKRYTNAELGFSVLLPPNVEPRTAPLGGGGTYEGDIEYTNTRRLIIETYGPESIDVGEVYNFRRVKYTQLSSDTTQIDELENIPNFMSYLQQKGVALEKLEGTNLFKIHENEFHYYGDKSLSITLSAGRHIEWMYNDNAFPIFLVKKQSAAALQIKELQLDILRTMEFFAPETSPKE